MSTATERRNFLKVLAATPALIWLLHQERYLLDPLPVFSDDARPNVLILVYDTLAADHMSVYGYPRDTTPHFSRFASQADVYHAHFAGGNFTTPGTASLFTGVYPWTHRAFNISASMDLSFKDRNLFSLFKGTGYYRLAYTHNWLANFFLHQFKDDLDLLLEPETYFLKGTPGLGRIFSRDREIAQRSSNFLSRIVPTERTRPGSLFLSLLNEMWLEQFEAGRETDAAALFPEGLPEEAYSKSFFMLEHAINGIMDLLERAPRPFLGYFHLYPPHYPYHSRREFIGKFEDGWAPQEKKPHFFSTGEEESHLVRRRQRYDEYLAYADAEFGRLYDYLTEKGLLDNTLVIFTSDHGEMFERGIKGHNTPVLFNPLVHVPLLVHRPGQRERMDYYEPTSCTDLLPELAQFCGLPAPEWCEGRPLTAANPGDMRSRSIFSIDARSSAKYQPLTSGTISIVRGSYKLIYYFGYEGYENECELYDLDNDPQELADLFTTRSSIASELRDELLESFYEHRKRYARS